jgi:hypothetical protein
MSPHKEFAICTAPVVQRKCGTTQRTEHGTNQYDNGQAHFGVLGEAHQ